MCRLLALKDLVLFLFLFYFDVGRLLFGDLLRIALLKTFLNFIDEIFFEDNSIVVKKAFHTCRV